MLGLFHGFGEWSGFSWLSLRHCSASFPSYKCWPRNGWLCFLITTSHTHRSWLPVGTCPTEPTITSSHPPAFLRVYTAACESQASWQRDAPRLEVEEEWKRLVSHSCTSPLATSWDMLQWPHCMMTGLTRATHCTGKMHLGEQWHWSVGQPLNWRAHSIALQRTRVARLPQGTKDEQCGGHPALATHEKGSGPRIDLGEEHSHEQHLQHHHFSSTSHTQQPQGSFLQQYYLLCLVYGALFSFFFFKWSSHYLFFQFLGKLLKPTIHSYGNMPWPINYFIPSYSDTKGKKALSKVWFKTPEEGQSPKAGGEPA